MKRLAIVFLALGIWMAAGAQSTVMPRSAHAHTAVSAQARLEFVTVPAYRVSVQGWAWGAQTEVTFVLQAGTLTRQLVLLTTPAGTFVIGITNIDMCSPFRVEVRDGVHTVTLASVPAACPPTPSISTPMLSVLQGMPIDPSTGNPMNFADPAFARLWRRTDSLVARHLVDRSWLWGPSPISGPLMERYREAANGERLVQYFDKSRMETNHGVVEQSNPFYVTTGLLVTELVSGRLQTGDNSYEVRAPAGINVAGDSDDPTAPTYASFGRVTTTIAGVHAAPDHTGQLATATIDRVGAVADDPSKNRYLGIDAVHYEAETGHNIPRVFWDFLHARGAVVENEHTIQAVVITPWFYASGLPISEPYWARVQIAGEPKDVLIQAFERRVLTYTPANPVPFQVEMGNVGQHYATWRYGTRP